MSKVIDITTARSLRVVPAQKPHRSVQEVATPWPLIRAIERRWGGRKMDFDLCALASNAKAPKFFTPEQDGRSQIWSKIPSLPKKGARLWCNPPYGNTQPWVLRAARFAQTSRCKVDGAKVLVLVPASVGSNWWAEYVHGRASVLFLRPRIKFVGHKQGYPKDLVIVCYGDKPGYDLWDGRETWGRRLKK